MAQANLAGRYTVIKTEEAAESTRLKKIRKVGVMLMWKTTVVRKLFNSENLLIVFWKRI